jgi:hypothetical protein
MKIAISESALLDLDAPVLSAYETVVEEATLWAVWCKHCQAWHYHGAGEGHREAHCKSQESPYWKSGYNLAYAGRLEEQPGHP